VSNQRFDAYFTAPAMHAIFCDAGRVQGVLDFEAALVQRIDRDAAHHLVEQCCRLAVRQGVHLCAVLGANAEFSAQLSAAELERLLDPARYLGQARRWIQRAVAEHTQFSR
jgi:3-carboxy-cis,cis-muconate cycloisomerase